MKVLLVAEWTNPKEPERNRARYRLMGEWRPYHEKLVKEKGIKMKGSGWSNGSGQMINTAEFETFEDFEKLMTDLEWRKHRTKWSYTVDDLRTRIMFESFQMPPKT